MKYYKKPVVVEAEQWHPGKLVEGVCEKAHNGFMDNPHIHTLEGQMEVTDGDWVIKGVKGGYYPVKNDIFLETYEKVVTPRGDTSGKGEL